ncbi:MAG TPA: hypothetical protein VGJ84_22655 [Polyangiaceae bacterium]
MLRIERYDALRLLHLTSGPGVFCLIKEIAMRSGSAPGSFLRRALVEISDESRQVGCGSVDVDRFRRHD